jgi:hypothetical protein
MGLRGNLPARLDQACQVVEGPVESAPASTCHRVVAAGRGQRGGRGLGLVAGRGTAQAQLRRDRVRPLARGAAAITHASAQRPPRPGSPRPVTAIRRTALASKPESVGYATSAGTTVVSARNWVVRSSLACAAFSSSASLYPATAASPQRVISFINVVGCGPRPSSGIRQNRRQVIESLTSRYKLS